MMTLVSVNPEICNNERVVGIKKAKVPTSMVLATLDIQLKVEILHFSLSFLIFLKN